MGRLSLIIGCFVFACAIAPLGAAQKATKATPKASKAQTAVTTPVNINTATAAQLDALPGIGARTAQLIVEHRQKNGPFKKVEELMNIKGIGEKSFLKLKAMVTVGPEKADHAPEKM